MDVRQVVAWLFVRDEESIRITREPAGLVLVVCGPGSAEHSHHFDSEASLEEFRTWYEERLDGEGWIVQGSVERRVAAEGSKPLRGPERRRGRRTS